MFNITDKHNPVKLSPNATANKPSAQPMSSKHSNSLIKRKTSSKHYKSEKNI